MSRVKSQSRKQKLVKAARRNRRMPIFVAARTKRRLTQNPFRRNWRKQKMDLKDD